MKNESGLRPSAALWLHVSFAATGFGTTLLGCLLPALHSAWRLSDSRAGILFACQFAGASAGALLLGKNFFRSLLLGDLMLVASGTALGVAQGHIAEALFFAFGLGLGLAMTATSMLVGTLFESRGAALSLLNASWVIGAVLSPPIASLWVLRETPAAIYKVFAAALAGMALMIWYNRKKLVRVRRDPLSASSPGPRLAFITGFSLLAFLYVGVEVSVSGWMMTYVHRLPVAGPWAAAITSCFWIALLCGRTIAPAVLLRVSETRLFASAIMVALISLVLLLLGHTSIAILVTAVSAGLALAPIFPLCIARVLALTNESPQTKWVFAIAGFGGAVLPWMTGGVSTYSASLRDGLLVPVFALGVMALLFQRIVRRTRGECDSANRMMKSAKQNSG